MSGTHRVVDTPWTNSQSAKFIDWLKNSWNTQVVGVIPTHTHQDNIGGLTAFHQKGIPSYALLESINSATARNMEGPLNPLQKNQPISVQGIDVEFYYPGPGHTEDSCTVYYPADNLLFGGCSVKARQQKTPGNLSDAIPEKWIQSLLNLKSRFPETQIVIPGHGPSGNLSLLDWTISLLKEAGY